MAEVRLTTFFVGKDVSTAATMNEIGGVATNTGRRLEEMGRRGASSMSLMEREMSRFRRHMGYATAGLATYEIFNAISRLKDYQNEIATLNATLGATPAQLQQFSKAAFDISSRTGTALDDVFQSMQNIINSFPAMSEGMRQTFVPYVANIEAMGARVSQTDPRTFGAVVSGLADAFFGRARIQGPGGEQLIDRIAKEVVATQRRIPNPQSGQQFLMSMPMLAQGAVTAGFSLEDALSMYGVAQRVLVNPRTTSQYLRQLFTRLHAPTRASQPFFRQAGIGPEELSSLTGPQILNRLIQYGLTLPGGINPEGATDEQVAAFMRHPSWKRLRVQGPAMQFFRQSIGGRIQSSVAMTALLQNLQQIPMERNALRNAPTLETRFQQMDISMSQAASAFGNITTELGTTLLPVINPLAHAMVKLQTGVNKVTDLLNRERNFLNQHLGGHPVLGVGVGDVAEVGTIAAGIFGARRFSRLFREGRVGNRLFRRLPGMRRLFAGGGSAAAERLLAPERVIMETEAAASALAGVAHGTPAAPFWVVIHPLSMSQIPALRGNGLFNDPINPKNAAKTAEHDAEKLAEGAGGRAAFKRLAQRIGYRAALARMGLTGAAEALGVAGIGAAAGVGYGAIYVATRGQHRPITATTIDGQTYHVFPDGTLMPVGMRGRRTLANQFIRQLGGHNVPLGLQSYFRRFERGQLDEPGLNRAIQNYIAQTMRSTHGHPQTFLQNAIMAMFRLGPGHQMRLSNINRRDAANGFVEATLTLEPSQEFRNLIRPQQVRVHIPISDLPASKSRGQTKTARK